MSIRTKTLGLIGVLSIALLLVITLTTYRLLLQDLSRQEHASAGEEMLRVRDSMTYEFTELTRLTQDWASWDETYRFIQGKEPGYLQRNISSPAVLNMGIDFIAYITTANQLHFARLVDARQKSVTPMPPALAAQFRVYLSSMRLPDMHQHLTGFIQLSQRPMLISVQPILRSDFTGPIRGAVIMGRWLEPRVINALTTRVDSRLSVYRESNAGDARHPCPARITQPLVTRTLDASTLAAYTLYRDIDGKRGTALQLSMPRTIYRNGMRHIRLMIGVLLGIGVCFSLAMLWLVEFVVLRRVLSLEAAVQQVGVSGDLSARLPNAQARADGDELERLAMTVNGMLDDLETSRLRAEAELRETDYLLRLLLDTSPNLMLVKDNTGCIILANQALADFCQRPLDHVVGRIDRDVYAGIANGWTQYEHWIAQDPLLHATREPVDCVEWLIIGDERCCRHVRKYPVALQDGREGIMVMVEDITERKLAEEALERERAYLAAAIDVLPLPMFFVDAQRQCFRANAALSSLCERLGIPSLCCAAFHDASTHLPLLPDQYPIAQALNGEIITGRELIAETPNGDEVPLVVHAAPIRIDGAITAAVGVAEDITMLKEADRAKDEFLAVLSHELHTPLTIILGWSELALATSTGDFHAQAMEVVYRNARRQRLLVDELLDVSRLIHRKLSIKPVLLDLAAQARQAVENLLPLAEQHQLCLTAEICTTPLPVMGDPSRLHQCIANLLQNSLKFTPPGGAITLCARKENDRAIVTVHDTGRGMAPEALANIFTPFHQVDRDEKAGGLGLGLALVRGIVELHGGCVCADSAGIGYGASFTIELPLSTAELPLVTV